MREFIKVVCVLIIMVTCVWAAFVWSDDRPDSTTWYFRIGCPILTLVAIGIFLKIHLKADVVSDYLRQQAGNYLNRGGFCFAFDVIPIEGICQFCVYFQNQRDQPCRGRIALRQVQGFFMNPEQIETITFEILCEPAAFGIAKLAIPLPQKLQGKRQAFEVGASVDYPQGKGKRLRFHDGIVLRHNADFGNKFGTALTIAGAMGGAIVFSKPAKATIKFPIGVAEDISEGLEPEILTLWKLGDPPLAY